MNKDITRSKNVLLIIDDLQQQLQAEQQARDLLINKLNIIHSKLETLRFDGFMHKLQSLNLLDEILQAIKEDYK